MRRLGGIFCLFSDPPEAAPSSLRCRAVVLAAISHVLRNALSWSGFQALILLGLRLLGLLKGADGWPNLPSMGPVRLAF